MPFEKACSAKVELEFAIVRNWHAAAREKPALTIARELFEAVPDYGDVLITIRDTNTSRVDAADRGAKKNAASHGGRRAVAR